MARHGGGQPESLGMACCLLRVLLLDEGVGDGLHAVLRADEHHGGAPAHHQAQLPGVLCELVLVVRVSHVFDGAIQHEVEEWVKPFQDSTGLSESPRKEERQRDGRSVVILGQV